MEFSLLRYCYSFSKFAYCLRTCIPEHVVVCYERFDGLQEQAFTQIMGRPLNDAGKQQALLPVKKGGAGLRSAKQHCSAAFIASVAQTRAIVDSLLPQNIQRRSLDSAFLALQQATGNATYTDLSLLPPEFSQHSLSLEIDNFNFTNLLTSSDDRNRARLRSLALPHAGDWVDAIPSPSLNLNLDSRSFGAVMGYRLGLSLMQEKDCDSIPCQQFQDKYGDHAMHCRDDHGIRGGRHDRIRDKIFNEAQRASLNPTKEMPRLVPGRQSRPADVFIPQWLDGRKVAFDVSVVSPTQEALLHRAADTSAVAIESRKATKIRTHFDNCRAEGIFFQPLVVESFGGWDKDAVFFLKKIATQEARRWGKLSAIEIKHFFQRLSIALQRGNAALLIERDQELPNTGV